MDDFEKKLRATAQIKKLMALAAGNTNQNEADAAMRKARTIAAAYGVDILSIRPDAPLSKADKLAAARRNSAAFSGTFKKAYPGQDTEDYTKYDDKGRLKKEERPDDSFSWDGEEY